MKSSECPRGTNPLCVGHSLGNFGAITRARHVAQLARPARAPTKPNPSTNVDFHRSRAPTGMKREQLVKDLLPHNALAILVGPQKSGKSDLAAAIALAVATGRPFAGMAVDQGNVLWLDYDLAGFPIQGPESTNLYFANDLPPLDHEYSKQALAHAILEYKPKLVVIDSFYGAIRRRLSSRENALFQLGDIKGICPCTVLVLHHTGKRANHIADAYQIQQAADIILAIPARSRVSSVPARLIPSRAITVLGKNVPARTVVLQTTGQGCYRQPCPNWSGKPKTVPSRILSLLQIRPMTTKEITSHLAAHPGTTGNAISKLAKEGKIHKSRSQKYILRNPFENLNLTKPCAKGDAQMEFPRTEPAQGVSTF